MQKIGVLLILIFFLVGTSGCEQDPTQGKVSARSKDRGADLSKYPGDMKGAKGLLNEFLKPGADKAELSRQLRPGTKDFEAVFLEESAKKAETGYQTPWEEGKIVIRGKPDQTELLVWSETTENLKKGAGNAKFFPGGYSKAASHFKDGVLIYRFKFVRPGETIGFAWDGLVYVNGHWVIFPKPWRVVQGP